MPDLTTLVLRRGLRAMLVVALAGGVVACGDDSSENDSAEDVAAVVAVGDTAGLIQATADAVWVVTGEGVVRIDPETNVVAATVAMEQPEYILSDDTSLWASLFAANEVVRVDPATNSIIDTLDVPDNPAGTVVVADEIWVASHRGAAVLRFGIGETAPAASISVGELGPSGPLGLAAGMDSIWVGTPNIFEVSQIDPTTNEVVGRFPIPPGANPCGDIAVVDGRVQVSSCRVEPSISVIDPESGEVKIVQLDGLAVAVAVVDDAAWWAVQVPTAEPMSQLVRFDHESGSLHVVSVPGVAAIAGIAIAFGSVWVSDEANGAVTRFPIDILG